MAWQLDNADARDWMPGIEDNSIDLILIDPPYIISRDTGYKRGGNPRFHHLHADFGDWDKSDDDIVETLLPQLHRVLRPGGTLICFYDLWKITTLATAMSDAKFNQLRFIEWIKPNIAPINSSLNYLTNAREIALTGCKGRKPTFNGKHHNGMFKCPVEHDEHRFHPTPKPIALLIQLIKMHSDPGDLILDCFSGSGTTARAAILSGRGFVGCEIDPDYHRQSIDILMGIRGTMDFLE